MVPETIGCCKPKKRKTSMDLIGEYDKICTAIETLALPTSINMLDGQKI
jgi:hypothetical protein